MFYYLFIIFRENPLAIRLLNFISNIKVATISCDAKYIVTVTDNYSIQFWLWTYGLEKPNGIYIQYISN